MEKFLQVDLLGNLYIEEVFLFYDEPLLFSCRNLFGHIFLVNCVDLSVESKTWLALPISKQKIDHIKKNNISLYDAFTKPEDDILWSIFQKQNQQMATASRIAAVDLLESDLPRKNAYIDLEDINEKLYETYENDDERLILAKKENRILFDLSLELNEGHSSEITPDVLAKAVVELQDTLFSIAHKNGSLNSKFPNSLVEENQLHIVDTFAASFGIRFMSKQLCDIFGELSVSRSIDIFVELLNVKDNAQKTREILDRLSPKVGLHYRRFLLNLINNRTSIKMHYTTPKTTTSSINISLNELKMSLDTLESEIESKVNRVSFTGTLVGVDVRNKTFSFTPDNMKIIRGKISEKVNVEHYIVPQNATVSLEEKVIINKVTGKEEISYLLSNIIE